MVMTVMYILKNKKDNRATGDNEMRLGFLSHTVYTHYIKTVLRKQSKQVLFLILSYLLHKVQ